MAETQPDPFRWMLLASLVVGYVLVPLAALGVHAWSPFVLCALAWALAFPALCVVSVRGMRRG